jgi:undecaprenyl diphosphate synthase
MDGNRRWATKQGFMGFLGHKAGWDAVKRVVDFCLEKQILYLSLYAFSLENLQGRSQVEQHYLFEVLAQEALQDLEMLKHKNICIRFIGDRTLFPASIRPV